MYMTNSSYLVKVSFFFHVKLFKVPSFPRSFSDFCSKLKAFYQKFSNSRLFS